MPLVALCDGAGQAQQVARRALGLLERHFQQADAEDLALFPTWVRWVRAIDSALRGGAESTLVAVAVLEDRSSVPAPAIPGPICGAGTGRSGS